MLCATQQQLQRRLCSQAVKRKPRTPVTLVRAMADSTKVSAGSAAAGVCGCRRN